MNMICQIAPNLLPAGHHLFESLLRIPNLASTLGRCTGEKEGVLKHRLPDQLGQQTDTDSEKEEEKRRRRRKKEYERWGRGSS